MNSVKKRTAKVKSVARALKKRAAKILRRPASAKPARVAKPAAKPAAKPVPPPKPPPLPPRGVFQQVRFEFHDPKAKEVYLVGTFNGWEPHRTPMKKLRDGTWTVAIQLSAGRHEYRILADGHWRDDPKASHYERNPFGGRNSVVEVALDKRR